MARTNPCVVLNFRVFSNAGSGPCFFTCVADRNVQGSWTTAYFNSVLLPPIGTVSRYEQRGMGFLLEEKKRAVELVGAAGFHLTACAIFSLRGSDPLNNGMEIWC